MEERGSRREGGEHRCDDPIRKNDAAMKELVGRKNDTAIKELVPLGDETPASKIKHQEEKGQFNLAWKNAGPEEPKKELNSTWTDEEIDSNVEFSSFLGSSGPALFQDKLNFPPSS